MPLHIPGTAIISLLLLLCLNSCAREKAYNVPKCSTIWNGHFYNVHDGIADIKISRNGDLQIERTKDGAISKYKVDWLDSCRYRLTYLSENKRLNLDTSRPVIIQITSVNDYSYTIEGWVEGTHLETYRSEIFRER